MDRLTKAQREILRGRHFGETFTAGDAGKIADIIADALVDAARAHTTDASVALDVTIHDHEVRVCGFLDGVDELDIESIVLGVLRDIGHADARWGVDLGRIRVRSQIQSANGGRTNRLDGGRQLIVRGFAVRESGGLPTPLTVGRQLITAYERLRATAPVLGPDARVLVGVDYDFGRAARIASVTFTAQHDPSFSLWNVRDFIYEEVIRAELGDLVDGAEILINPGGPFLLGGPTARAGFNGRRTAADTYGGLTCPGPAALSGRDGGRLERCGVYAARDLALHFLELWEARIAEVQLVFASGKSSPIALRIATDTAGDFDWRPPPNGDLVERLSVEAITPLLSFDKITFRDLATNGHFGRDHLPWEEPRLKARGAHTAPDPELDPPSRPSDAALH